MILPAAPPFRAPQARPLTVLAVLEGRSVAVTLDGRVVLDVNLGGNGFRRRVGTGRETVLALVDALHPERFVLPGPGFSPLPPAGSGSRAFHDTVPGLPEGAGVSLPEGYVYRTDALVRPATHLFTSPDGPTVRLVLGLDPARPPTPAKRGENPGWLVEDDLFGRRLAVRGGRGEGLSVRYAPATDSPTRGLVPIVATDEATPRAALVAVLAALTYRPAP